MLTYLNRENARSAKLQARGVAACAAFLFFLFFLLIPVSSCFHSIVSIVLLFLSLDASP